MKWQLVTEDSPRNDELPATVVRSKSRNLAYWRTYIAGDQLPLLEKMEVSPYFEPGEIVCTEDWFPPPS